MSASKHTPGPWEVDMYGDVTANGEDVARIATTGECAERDARLIAAAPELLEALRPFISATLTPNGAVIGLMREDFERAAAAYAKAIGA